MELNAEQIKKALECCKTPLASDCENCSYTGKILEDGVYEGCVNCLVGDALSLINSQEQKIFELENRLKECENGYEGTLFLDRCKLHDAEEKVKELTEESKKWEQAYDCMDADCRELSSKCDRLTEENERLNAEGKTLEIYNKDYKYKNKELAAFNRRWAKECAELQEECEYIKDETIKKMQERLDKRFCHDPAFLGVEQRLIMGVIDQIAKEMLEGV